MRDPGLSERPADRVVLAGLAPPLYPPLARQARITGKVKVQVSIRQDGTIELAEAISGHPMLKLAAVESGQKSAFECPECGTATTTYSLTYAFEISGDCHFGPHCEQTITPPKVEQSQDRVTLTVEPACLCDPAATATKVRAAKCLYLWKCGFRKIQFE